MRNEIFCQIYATFYFVFFTLKSFTLQNNTQYRLPVKDQRSKVNKANGQKVRDKRAKGQKSKFKGQRLKVNGKRSMVKSHRLMG